MENELSMNSRAEVTTKYAKAYVKAAKGDKGRILDEVVGVTGWSRDHARRRLSVAAKRSPGGDVPILFSSGFGMRGGEVSMGSDHGVEDVGLAAGEADECGVVLLALGSLAVVVGAVFGIGSQGCEPGLE